MDHTPIEIDAIELDEPFDFGSLPPIDEPLDFGSLPPIDEIPPPPMLRRQYAVDANGNDPTIVQQAVFISMDIDGG
jgi:hypothetical protein